MRRDQDLLRSAIEDVTSLHAGLCAACGRRVPRNEAAAYGGRHEDCAISAGIINGSIPIDRDFAVALLRQAGVSDEKIERHL